MLEEGPRISVVIPTFDRAGVIADALDSVADQTLRPLEVIVVDDGSTDDTEAVVRRWASDHDAVERPFLVRYVHQENRGGNVARNRGIAEGKGEFVAFLDSDDVWHPGKLQKQMAVIQASPEIGGVYCGVRQVDLDSDRVIEPIVRSYPCGRLLDQLLVRDVTAPTSTYLLRREVFEQIGDFDTELQARQDWDMWIRLASKYEIGVVPESLVDYRDHAGLRTASNPEKEMAAYTTILHKYADLRSTLSPAVQRASKAAFYRRMGRVHFHHSISYRKALSFQLRSIACWPWDFDTYAALGGMMLPRSLRRGLHRAWNRVFGKSRLAIRSH